jgi:serine kinase of HPr protein (carbohydrate metabolism regulator)
VSNAPNKHAVALVLADKGLLILGPSGSGKTTLALALLSHMQASGRFARLVADDQVFLSTRGGRLLASAPETIAGLAEAYGAGPAGLPHLPRAVIDLAVRLVEPAEAPRISDSSAELLLGYKLPLLELRCRNAEANIYPVLARLGLPPFCRSSPPTA